MSDAAAVLIARRVIKLFAGACLVIGVLLSALPVSARITVGATVGCNPSAVGKIEQGYNLSEPTDLTPYIPALLVLLDPRSVMPPNSEPGDAGYYSAACREAAQGFGWAGGILLGVALVLLLFASTIARVVVTGTATGAWPPAERG